MSNTSPQARKLYAGYKADHVGSFLRPLRLKEARQAVADAKLSQAELTQIENEEILKIIELQKENNIKAITDGELRRAWWHYDFMENLIGAEGYEDSVGLKFHGVETKPHNVRIVGKLDFPENHPHLAHYKFLHDAVGTNGVAKMTIPSPNMMMRPKLRFNNTYGEDIQQYVVDLGLAYRKAVQAFYELGCRYLQIDDVFWAYLISEEDRARERAAGVDLDQLADFCVQTLNIALENKPEDLVIGLHICRGNFSSTWHYQGGYESIEDYIFKHLKNIDRYFLEYDTERAGGFEPLAKLQGSNAEVVLGLITSKVEELENKQAIIARIHEASQYLPLEQLALSPQCGFSSTEEGNRVPYDAQWRKLQLVNEIVAEVWGE
ncbi:5-methyltetrahydropteroyltriglutamate--homocysteine S-methyltransferase [Acinetobacter radioresistens]|uniref:5-methyltetrahydropteroyltriglutamate-- homocysteine S-methyltransferase n=1 Tax=Acinetobacter radioresistens TaxID=40216 RepID=UPI002247C6EC|nr:5-methyltetrahydropteroyltriglutamate--homocysteine S-methyltransferase [Acinetobacter radioresistens]MCX0339521.1 5-methyltetrahydropteroyltriglutamate--homocysteine S-methyltransferase [Acinetobacter radioresistens]